MYGTVADAALIEAAQRIAPLVRACRDEGERERRLPAQVLAAMHEARLFRMYIEGAGWPRNRPDHVDDCRRGDRPCRRRGGAEFDARRHLRSVGGLLARACRARDLRRPRRRRCRRLAAERPRPPGRRRLCRRRPVVGRPHCNVAAPFSFIATDAHPRDAAKEFYRQTCG